MSTRFGRLGSLVLVVWIVAGVYGSTAAQPSLPLLRGQHLVRPQSVEAGELDALPARLEKEGIAQLRLAAAPRAVDAARRVIDAVHTGEIDFAVVPLAALGSSVPRFRVFEIPFLFRDERHAMAVQIGNPGSELLKALQQAGLEGVGWWPGETLVLASRRPVLEPADLSGLRIAALSASSGYASALELFCRKAGTVPVEVPPAQILAELQSGAIDVIEASLTELQRLQPAKLKLSVTLTDHLYSGYVAIANPARWAELPISVRVHLAGELRLAHDDTRRKMDDAVQTARQALEDARVATLFPVPPTVRSMWREALRSESLASQAGLALVDKVEEYTRFKSGSQSRDLRRSISWNAWFEDGSQTAPKDVGALEVNRIYRFYLDLARYPYTKMLSTSAGQPIEKLLTGEGERHLLLQPVLLGRQLEAAPGRPLRPQELTVHLERMREGRKDEKLLESFDKGKLTTRALSHEVNLGGFISWDMKTSAVGCGGVAVTVWDQERVTPLDHIVLQIPVRAGDEGPKECKGQDTHKAMNAGMLTLLDGPAASAGSRVADAALHVFESKDDGKLRSRAVFVHRERLIAALADPNATDSGVYSWQLASALSTYVSDPSQLPEMIRAAHKAVGQRDSQPFPYEEVARELAQKIFSGASQQDQAEAASALAALQAVVEGAPTPTVVLRLISADGKVLFVPFGLLAAQREERIVAKRFTLIQPLPQPRQAGASCIDTWRFARPRELQGVSGDARDLLKQAADAPPPAGISVIDNHGALAEFLGGKEGSAENRGDGLIVLAHHDQGYLKFNDSDRPPARIGQEFITRRFPPGSAVVLAACATVGELGETGEIVDRFAGQGIEALIVSPFSVDAEFGTRFALEFEKVLAGERSRGSGANLLQLFERTAANIASAYENQAAMRDMALEFMLIGNPDVRLCE